MPRLLESNCGAGPSRPALAAAAALMLVVPMAGAPSAGAAGDPFASANLVEGRLLLALPAALDTGMMTGVELGFTRGRSLAWGARASWATATEHTVSWTVRHDDIRLRATGAALYRVGRARLGLRVGIGATIVHEDRTLSQGERAGLSGASLSSAAWRLLPAAELEPTVVLGLVDAWGISLSGGPALHVRDGRVALGWVSGLGVAWRP